MRLYLQPRKAGARPRRRKSPARTKLTSAGTFLARQEKSRVSVTVNCLPARDRRPEVLVDDSLHLAGDSFASGESNQTVPVQFQSLRGRWSYDSQAVCLTRSRWGRASRPRSVWALRQRLTTTTRTFTTGLMEERVAEKSYRLSSPRFSVGLRQAAAKLLTATYQPLFIWLPVPGSASSSPGEPGTASITPSRASLLGGRQSRMACS